MLGKSRIVGAAVGAGLIGAALFAAAAPAQADNGTPGQRETVCADSLYVRTDPGGAFLGTLYHPQTFDVDRVSGGWVYGFAYGNVNRHGWVQDGWFC
jgi:hypothetical protein